MLERGEYVFALLENSEVNVDEGVSVTLSCVGGQFLSGILIVVRGLG